MDVRAIAVVAVLLSAPITGAAAVQLTIRDSVVQVMRFYSDVHPWLSYESARLAVQEYGKEAGLAAAYILEDSALASRPWLLLLAAVGVTAYEASGFPIDRLQDLASGRQVVSPDANRNYGFRLAALRALASRPRPSLSAYWQSLLRDEYVEVRRAAVSGLSCALGIQAIPVLHDAVAAAGDSSVIRWATYQLAQLTLGDSARVCLYGLWTRPQAARLELPVDSGLLQRAERYFGFRRRG